MNNISNEVINKIVNYCPFCGKKSIKVKNDSIDSLETTCAYCNKQFAQIWKVKKSVAFKHKKCEHCDKVNSYLAKYCTSCGSKNTLVIKYSSTINPAHVITKDDVTGKSRAAIISLVCSIIGLVLTPFPIIDYLFNYFPNLLYSFWPFFSTTMIVMLIGLVFGFLGLKKSYRKGPAIIGLVFSIPILIAGLFFGIFMLIFYSLW